VTSARLGDTPHAGFITSYFLYLVAGGGVGLQRTFLIVKR
jgi:hypothetical protein